MVVDGSFRPAMDKHESTTTPAPRRTIPYEELRQLPIVRYRGSIHFIETEKGLHRAMQEIRSEHVVGFDTETRPTFRKGQFHAPSLVQIATGHAVHLFQLARLDFSQAL